MKEAVEKLLPIERNLFLSLNGSDSVLLDNIFWTITGRYIWVPMLIFLAVMFFYKRPWKEALLTTLAVVLVFTLCDQISSSFFKVFFQRLRPSHHPDFKDIIDTVRDYRSGGFSFISGHATNSFGIAFFLIRLYASRWLSIPVLTWASLNSYSRIYLGLHFISDILAGILVGSLLGLLVFAVYTFIRKRYLHNEESERSTSPYSLEKTKAVGITIAVYLLFVIILSPILSTLPH